jgi:hypothetical protein
MARLKTRTQHPPGGFQVIIPEIGMRKPQVGSFTYCVNFVMGVVRGNSFLAGKHGWGRSREWAEGYVDNQNAARCEAKPDWHSFLMMEAEPITLPEREIPDGEDGKKKGLWGNAVAGGKQLAAGVNILLDWLGSGGKPVDHALSHGRAAICATCPKNSGGDWRSLFTKPIADKIRQQLEMKNEMQLTTPHDEKLTVCAACACPLQLKVWTPLRHILDHTDAETAGKLDPRCWITREEQTPA